MLNKPLIFKESINYVKLYKMFIFIWFMYFLSINLNLVRVILTMI
jgi:hypothetical protein